MDRRDFLRRTSLALAGGLVVGPEAIEAFERLAHRPVFALGHPAPRVTFAVDKVQDRGFYFITASVLEYGRLMPVEHRSHCTDATFTGQRLDRAMTHRQIRFVTAKLGEEIARKHRIPPESMFPAMARAVKWGHS